MEQVNINDLVMYHTKEKRIKTVKDYDNHISFLLDLSNPHNNNIMLRKVGISDVNGDPIYEGHVLKAKNGQLYEVYYDEGQFYLKNINNTHSLAIIYGTEFEIVDWIFEYKEKENRNPKLYFIEIQDLYHGEEPQYFFDVSELTTQEYIEQIKKRFKDELDILPRFIKVKIEEINSIRNYEIKIVKKEEGRTINIEQQYKELKNKYDELLHALEWIASIKRSEFLERPEF